MKPFESKPPAPPSVGSEQVRKERKKKYAEKALSDLARSDNEKEIKKHLKEMRGIDRNARGTKTFHEPVPMTFFDEIPEHGTTSPAEEMTRMVQATKGIEMKRKEEKAKIRHRDMELEKIEDKMVREGWLSMNGREVRVLYPEGDMPSYLQFASMLQAEDNPFKRALHEAPGADRTPTVSLEELDEPMEDMDDLDLDNVA